MSKNKNIKIMEIKFLLTPNGELESNLKILEFFQEDLTDKQINKVTNKVNELTDILHSSISEINKKLENNNENTKDCLNCKYCIPIGEGDHICEENPHKIVLNEYIPSDDYNWCNGRYFRRR